MRSRGFLVAATLVSVTITCLNGCQRSPKNAFVAHGPLQPPPTGELKYAGTPPLHPFIKQAGNNYARTVFETDGPGNSHIEVRDFLIPPRSKSTLAALPGPAVMELAAGGATLSSGEKAGVLEAGKIQLLPAGKDMEFENPNSRPALIRLYIIRPR